MHIDCTGQGTPTVILDSGLGDSYISWHKVQPQIAQFARVCSYDRAGLGYSDSSPRPAPVSHGRRTAHASANAGISPPYILVGHSMGGYNVRLFASLYRSEVVGMVLVDSSHPEQQKRFPQALNDLDKTWVREQEFLAFSMPFGIPRLLGFCDKDGEVRAAGLQFSQHARRRRGTESIFLKAPPKPPPPARSAIFRSPSSLTIPISPNPTCPKTWSNPRTMPGNRCRMS
jgi:pimeloyl-ACP methyl ester carboxylesterase